MKEQDLLAIMYYFPPMGSVCVNRTFPFLSGLVDRGFKTHVLQAGNQVIPNQQTYDLSKFEQIISIPNYDYRWIKKKFFRQVHGNPLSSEFGRFSPAFYYLESPVGAMTLGEGGGYYSVKAYRQAVRLIKKYPIQYLYTSYRPLSDMLTAYYLKKKFPHLIWVADMRDHYLRYDIKNYISKERRIAYFRKILGRADKIFTVSNGIAQKMESELKKEVKVIPNGINEYTKTLPKHSEKFTISYTGSIYSFYELHQFFVNFSNWLDQQPQNRNLIQLCYAGKDRSIWESNIREFRLEDISVMHDLLSLEESRDIQANSNVNILFSYSSEEYSGVVTGKLYDLLGVHRPIICWINGQLDPDLHHYFNELKCGKIFATNSFNESAFDAFLNGYFEQWKTNKVIRRLENDHLTKYYNWDQRLEDLIDYL